MGLGIEMLGQLLVRMCNTRPLYQPNSFHLFLASLFSPGSMSNDNANSITNLFKEGEDDVISGKLEKFSEGETR